MSPHHHCLHSPAVKLCAVLIFGIMILYLTSIRITWIPFIKYRWPGQPAPINQNTWGCVQASVHVVLSSSGDARTAWINLHHVLPLFHLVTPEDYHMWDKDSRWPMILLMWEMEALFSESQAEQEKVWLKSFPATGLHSKGMAGVISKWLLFSQSS